tara:strand:+ start:221 stop:835 length:615 start_codon:yes stop_codon:yes gene_type:complete
MVKVNLLESDREIQKKINKALSKQATMVMNSAAKDVYNNLKPIVRTAIASSPAISSLRGGRLMADFGLTKDPTPLIIEAVADSIQVKPKKVTFSGSRAVTGMEIYIQPTSFANLFSLPVAEQVIKDGRLPWLKWLLTLGDTLIIADFGIEYGPFGRTGKARMTRKNAPFQVNPQFSGTASNNFISKALKAYSGQIKQVIIRTLK